MLAEISLHRASKHKNIVSLERVFEDQEHIYMLLELCNNNSLYFLLGSRVKLTVPETQYYLYQLISALSYLHSHNVIHRDIKLGNLLLDQNLVLKVGDFGLATKVLFPGDRKHSICGTPNYIAPEIISSGLNVPKSHSGHSYEVDVWSTGVIMYILLIGEPPFETNNRLATYKRVIAADYSFPKAFQNESAKDLIKKILVIDPFQRYTFEQVLNHPFMNPINGIPKSMPLISLKQVPKFKDFEKYEDQQQVKQQARLASITSIRQNPFHNLQEHVEDSRIGGSRISQRSKQKDIKGLMRCSYSSTSLQKSLQKLGRIDRNMSSKNLKLQTKNQQLRKKINQISPKNRANSNSKDVIQNQLVTSKANNLLIYVLTIQKDTIWSYLLNNGYIGTYETSNNYRLLFNKTENYYLEIINDISSQSMPSKVINTNENIINRQKYMNSLVAQSTIKCTNFINMSSPIYILRAYQIKAQNLVLFKLSNGNIQLSNMETQQSLLIVNNQVYLIEIQKLQQKSRFKQFSQNCINSSNKVLRSMYIKAKKIIDKISSLQKANKI